ncbi:MAG: hypothetical protein MJ214_03495 [Bacilli bacterium]|nr:hypothetical protein [Bacilli bacterium]
MTIQEIQTTLKERYPNLTFYLQKPTYRYKESLLSKVYNKDKEIRFEVMFTLEGNFLVMRLCLGKIEPNYETAFFLNKLNITLPICYKATIEKDSACNRYGLFVRYFQPISFPNQVPNIFYNASNLLFENTEFKILYKYVIDEDLKKRMN